MVGALAGYLFFTENGRRLRRSIEPALEDLARELSSFGASVQKAAGIAAEGWQLLDGALAAGRQTSHFAGPRQSSPF
jgi:hypothetical protein